MAVDVPANAHVTSFTCSNCGATTSAVALGSSIRCPFCGSEHVIDAPLDANAPRPESLLPFAFPDEQVDAVYRTWIGKGFFRPKDISEKAHSHKMRAVFVPVWDGRGDAQSQWTAQAGYNEAIPAPPSPPGQGGQSAGPQQRTRWEYAQGNHRESYERVLISGSKGLPQNWLERLGDLDWGQVKGYEPNFLIGREAEQSNIDRTTAISLTRDSIESDERSACQSLVPGDQQRDLRVNTQVMNVTTRLVYLPVWLASFQYGEKTFRCVVNGQNGKVSGEAPVNKFRVGAIIAAVVVIILIVIAIKLLT